MFGTAGEDPVLWWALLVLNVPLFVFMYRKLFADRRDLWACAVAGFRPGLLLRERFWSSSEGWSAGKFWLFVLGGPFLVLIEYELLIRLFS
jgi:hypothetical protein